MSSVGEIKYLGTMNEHTQSVRDVRKLKGRPALSYNCKKAGCILWFESPAEKTIAQLADLDPRIVQVKSQPFTVDVVTGRLLATRTELNNDRDKRTKLEVKRREYTPDFLFTLTDGRMLVIEIKDERFMGDDEYWEKVLRAEAIIRANGYEFVVMPFGYSPSLPLVCNAAILSAFQQTKKFAPSKEAVTAIEQMLTQCHQPLGEVIVAAGLSLRESPVLFLTGVVGADLKSERLNFDTPVWFSGGELSCMELLPLEIQ